MQFFTLLAITSPALAATCKLSTWQSNSQGSGGDAGTFQNSSTVTYADGTSEEISTGHSAPFDGSDDCYSSKLPHKICIKSNHNLSDGYITYGDDLSDFNADRCDKTQNTGPFWNHRAADCEFRC